MGERLNRFYTRFRSYLRTQTRDTSEYGKHYLSGLLRMEAKRNFANVGRKTEVPGQNMQHFISNSPWSGSDLIAGVQSEIKCHPAFQEAILVLDESADEKAGAESAGTGRQHNGRLGKVEMSQVGVFLSLVTSQVNTWIDGDLYIPAHWFEDSHAEKRKAVGMPEQRTFQTKPELGWQLVQRVQARGISFQALVMDDLYGRNGNLRQQLNQAGIEYYGDVPVDTRVFLERPEVVYPLTKRGQPAKNPKIQGQPCEVRELAQHLQWQTIRLRPNERGYLQADFGRCRVWVVYGTTVRQEWLLVRKDAKQVTYVLTNAAEEVTLETMAWRKTHRYLIERSNEDAKGEFGWDEFQARKYRAWEHQLALTILAAWFVAETRLDWMQRFQRDPALLAKYEVDVLPQLSVGNVRELLRAAMPLPQLSPDDAAQLVTSHLINRTRSRKSRLRKAKRKHLGLM
ncbi:MAG: IS701 family transposase [Anaerolineales bacterium]|nr:IS701 family transposase [Anaerolineales bacterium]